MLCCKCGDEIIPGREVHKFDGGVTFVWVGNYGEGGIMCEKCAFPHWKKRVVTNWWFKFAVVALVLAFLILFSNVFLERRRKNKSSPHIH
jgi:hypothetical protein